MLHLYLWMFGAMLAGHAGTVELPAHRVAEQPVPSPKSVHLALAGRWEGSLRYRDYQDSSRFVTLPTLLVGALSADSSRVQLDFEYDDGPGKTVRSRDAFALDTLGKVLTWGAADGKRPPSRFTVTSMRAIPLMLMVEMDGEDDDRSARIRETITIESAELRIVKEVRFAADGSWLFRHAYWLARKP